MNKFEQILDAFKAMDFEVLEHLLDDKRSYMDVPKHVFLNALKKEIVKEKGFTGYKNVLKGTCGTCNKGCTAYSYTADGISSLNLFFQLNNEEVEDIYLCHDFQHNDKSDFSIYFRFYDDEKVNFKADTAFLVKSQKVSEALNEIYDLHDSILTIEDLIYWQEKNKEILEEFNFSFEEDFFGGKKRYKKFQPFEKVKNQIEGIIDSSKSFLKITDVSKQALKEYGLLNGERDLVEWIIKYDKYLIYDETFESISNSQETGCFLIRIADLDLLIDCSSFSESLRFIDLHLDKNNELYNKYSLSEKQLINNSDYKDDSLIARLKFHGKYLDIIPSEE